MKVVIAYYSVTGITEKMAEYIAEGVRFNGHETVMKKIGEIRDAAALAGYDGYIFGSPTYSLGLPKPVETFLLMAEKAGLEGKMGGAFGPYRHDASYRHDTHAPAIIFNALQHDCKVKPFELGPFILKEETVEISSGMKTCQDYGRVFGEKLGG